MATLDALVDEFLREHFEEHPTNATFLGVDGYDDRLGDLSAEGFRRRDARTRKWIDRFSELPEDQLSPVEQVDRDLALSMMRGSVAMSDWEVWRRQPDAYLGSALNGVFGLFLHRLHPDEELTASASARLLAVPEALDHARANLDAELASKVFVERGLGQCRAAVTYARELVPEEVEDPGLRARLAEAGETAAVAFEDFAAFLEELLAAASGPYAIGEQRYSALLIERELLGYDTAELRRRGQASYEELDAELTSLAERAFDNRDWKAVVAELNRDHPDTPEQMRDEYETWTMRAREFLVEHELVTFPEGERCLVEPSPPFQRPVLAVASYFRPPAFKNSLTGRFNVPYPPDGTPPDEVRKRLENNSRGTIPTTSVHEAYPGHHWHLVVAQGGERPLRKVLSSAYFVEGWALYAERMMREQGFFQDPAHELCHLDARIFRAARIVADTGLHTGDMSFDEAVEFMRTRASLSEPVARAEVGRYCSWPTQASSYLTGALEIERMRGDYLARPGATLKGFHDTIAASGAMPVALAERALTTSS